MLMTSRRYWRRKLDSAEPRITLYNAIIGLGLMSTNGDDHWASTNSQYRRLLAMEA